MAFFLFFLLRAATGAGAVVSASSMPKTSASLLASSTLDAVGPFLLSGTPVPARAMRSSYGCFP